MRILHLTAGTGTWHCGTCIRDNALVRALQALGHDAELIPMYLPIVGDGATCSANEAVLIGGVNAYLQQEVPLFRVVPRWMDAVLSSRPLLALAGRFSGSTRPESLGAMTVSMLQGLAGHQRKEVERLLDALEARPRPDVVVLSNSLLAGLAGPIRDRLDVPVVCTVQGELHFLDALDEGREEAWRLTSQGLSSCDARIAVSTFAATEMARRTALDPADFDVVPNGIDVVGYDEPVRDGPLTLGFFARMYAPKGLDRLVEAFVDLRARGVDVRLKVGGTFNGGDRPEVDRAHARLKAAGLEHLASFHPNLSAIDKRSFLRDVSVFCVPTAKDETFGQYNLEALAAGVPVVAPRRGAVPEVLGRTGGAVLVPPDDHEALVAALTALLADPIRRAALGETGRRGVQGMFTDRHMAAREAAVLDRVVRRVAA